MRAYKCQFAVVAIALSLSFATQARAGLIPISGYDISDAVLSGHGDWAHTYTGTITPSGITFVNNTFPGETATYSGVGNGTLTDGIIGNSTLDTQLFVSPAASDGTPISPFITFTLPFAYTISKIEIYGGDITDNAIPGTITGVSVGLLDTSFNFHSAALSTTPFGSVTNLNGIPVDDSVDVASSSLGGIGAFAVSLFDFQGGIDNWFSITEVKIYGDPVATPEPSTLALALGAVCTGAGWFARKRFAISSV